MRVDVAGIGVWGPGFSNYAQFCEFSRSGARQPGEAIVPRPELIPPRERRRSPLMVKLAIEAADQACAMGSVDRRELQCVFSSGIGDSELTDYMCRVLAGPDKLLSPTKFHNSVHNAAVGYWSISTGCEQAATFVSSLDTSFTSALMEAMVQVASAQRPVLLVLSDIPAPAPMWNMHPIDHMFALAVVLCPEKSQQSAMLELGLSLEASATHSKSETGSRHWPALQLPALQPLYESSPSARSLCLLQAMSEAFATEATQNLRLPLSSGLDACVRLDTPPGFAGQLNAQ